MSRLGVSTFYTREKNLKIIAEHYKRNPNLTRTQVNMLSKFKAFKHLRGKSYPLCGCLRCHALHLINRGEL